MFSKRQIDKREQRVNLADKRAEERQAARIQGPRIPDKPDTPWANAIRLKVEKLIEKAPVVAESPPKIVYPTRPFSEKKTPQQERALEIAKETLLREKQIEDDYLKHVQRQKELENRMRQARIKKAKEPEVVD